MSMRELTIIQQPINRESASLDKYLSEIGRVELITAEEEVRLARQIKQGDEKALEKLTKANLRFVVSVAKQYQSQEGLPLPDLINEGNIGLIKAAKRFDETRGFKFISYAVWWIREEILLALATKSRIVYLPINKTDSINEISKTFSRLEQRYERQPSHEEVARELGISEEDVRDVINSSGKQVSMDAPLLQGEDGSLIDVMANENQESPDDGLIRESLERDIKRVTFTLHWREALVLRLYYGLFGEIPLTLEEIGTKIGLGRERVRQINEKAIRRMKNTSRSALLKTYLG